MIRHFLEIALFTGIFILCIFLPYIPGDYDNFATGLSTIMQFAAFTALLLVPVGLIWLMFDIIKWKKNESNFRYVSFCRKVALVLFGLITAAAALGAFVSHHTSIAIIILTAGMYLIIKFRTGIKQVKNQEKNGFSPAPCYLICIPLGILCIWLTFLAQAKEYSTNYAIKQSEQLIQDIEAYKKINGHYPVSLQSTIEDYKPFISGISRYHYELNGNGYNVYFEQFSDKIGTQEIVMYNKLDEHEMTVHNQDLLRIAPENISRGYHDVNELPNTHWKVFLFD